MFSEVRKYLCVGQLRLIAFGPIVNFNSETDRYLLTENVKEH